MSTTPPSGPSQPTFNLTGMWEVWAQSTAVPGTAAIIDVNLTRQILSTHAASRSTNIGSGLNGGRQIAGP